jgi:MtrB/PioB family decaheme-associated outer membrane protein
MHRLVCATLIGGLGLALASAAQAQTSLAAPSAGTAISAPAVVSPDSSDAIDPQTPTPQAAAPAAPAATAEELPGLFQQTWHQFQFGGRATSISGDPARFQRYQDLTNGVTFSDFRFAHEDPAGLWAVRTTADNVGYRDQKYTGVYEKTGKMVLKGLWDEIPQFYSVDTKTPYVNNGTALVLDDATQQAAQNGGGLSVWLPVAQQFDLRERRDIGNISFLATPTPQLDVKATFTSTRHTGELPWGGSFGFGNDVEVALPYDSRTNDLSIGTEWKADRKMLRVGYDGSWFNNLNDTLIWDSPLRLTDSTSAPGRGQMALWPTNSSQTVSVGGYEQFQHRTQLTGFLSFASRTNDQPLLPFTINSALPQLTLPRATAQADAMIFTTNLNLSSHPKTDWGFTAHFRRYGYDNHTPATAISQYVSYDTSVHPTNTGGPDLFAHSRTSLDGDATWTGYKPVALTVGYTFNNAGYDERIFGSTNENGFRVSADAVGTGLMSLHAKYEFANRVGSNLDTSGLVAIGEQPDMRHYDLANRTHNQFTGIVDFAATEQWTFSVSGGVGKDNYPDSYFGLQHWTTGTFSVGADYQMPDGIVAGGTYNYEHYAGLQRSRSANSSQANDPSRDWTADTVEDVNYFSIYVTPPKFGGNTEARLSYDFSYAQGSYVYGVVPGGPLPPPSQLPNVYNKLQQLHLDVRHRLSAKFVLAFSYLYEPFSVYDFAFDPTVVNSIIQPSSLVLGYVYRPYTANSFNFALRYFW